MIKNSFISLFLLFITQSLFAQNDSIIVKNITFVFINEQVEISYDIENAKPTDQLTISIDIYKTSGSKLAVRTLSGDIGTGVIAGNAKKIIWKPREDGYILNEDIYIQIQAKKKPDVSVLSHVMRSAVMPGWGDYKIRNGNSYWLVGALAYGSLASSIMLNIKAYNTYNNYLGSMNIGERNNYYNTFKTQKTLSLTMLGTAIATWAIDMYLVKRKASKVKKNITPENSRYYYDVSQKTIAYNSPSKFVNTKLPFDLALEKGDRLKEQKLFEDARFAYKEALIIKPSDFTAKNKLDEVEKIIASLKAKDEEYKRLITQADNYVTINQLENAKSYFEKANTLKPEEPYPSLKIKELTQKLEQKRIDSEYAISIAKADNAFKAQDFENAKQYYQEAKNSKSTEIYPISQLKLIDSKLIDIEYKQKIAKANNAFKVNDLETAKQFYQDALDLKSTEAYPSNQIKLIDNKIAKIEQDKIDIDYVKIIHQADIAFNKMEYDLANTLYSQAQELKPSESYPRKKIIAINKMMDIKITESKNGDLSNLFVKCKSSVFLIVSSDLDGSSQGSGFFISPDGTAITNYHVYNGSYWQTAKIYTEDGEYSIDKILDKNEEMDYIIFKVKSKNKTFPAVKIAPNMPKIGEKLFAIGNPEGLQLTLSDGIVSGFRESFDVSDFYIQTTTAITHGSSGGPLFNSKGEVIGITTKGKQSGSLFFAINILKLPISSYLK